MVRKAVVSPWKAGIHHITSPYNTNNPAYRQVYHGPILLPGTITFPPAANSSDSELTFFGTKAISMCSPTNAPASLATDLLELYRDGLPKLLGAQTWATRTQRARDVFQSSGSEYLNVEFGWKPLVGGIVDFMSAATDMDTLIQQYVRDSGRVVRRRYSFPPIVAETSAVVLANRSVTFNPNGALLYDSSTTNKGSVIRTRLTTIRRWFSGAFTYHLPKDWADSSSDRIALAKRLLGIDLNPDVVWNLAPWSWAVDWFASVGDVIANASAISADGLVLRYGYIMEHSIVRDRYQFVGPTGLVSGHKGRPDVLDLIHEVKLRRSATPFGFGLNLETLSSRQKAIIAALGISRSPR